MRTTNSIPGLSCGGLEFFTDKGKTKFLRNGKVRPLARLDFPIIEKIKKKIGADAELDAELKHHHPDSEWKRIEMFIRCRYGGIDHFSDMDNGELTAGDFWPCPLRGKCRSEGIICRSPVYEGVEIEKEEVKMIQLLTTADTNETIADKLAMPMGTFHLVKKNLYNKLNVFTKQELTIIAIKLNLI